MDNAEREAKRAQIVSDMRSWFRELDEQTCLPGEEPLARVAARQMRKTFPFVDDQRPDL